MEEKHMKSKSYQLKTPIKLYKSTTQIDKISNTNYKKQK